MGARAVPSPDISRAPSSSTLRMTSRARERAPTDGIRCRRRRRWPPRSDASASAPARRWLPTTRTPAVREPPLVDAALHGARRGGGARRRMGQVDSRGAPGALGRRAARGRGIHAAPPKGDARHGGRGGEASRRSRRPVRRCALAGALRRDSPIRSTTCRATSRARAIVSTRTTWPRTGRCAPPTRCARTFTRVLGDRSADQVVMYCGSGITACQNLLAMEHAGLRGTKLFAGSWSEWEADPARPVEKRTCSWLTSSIASVTVKPCWFGAAY